MHSSRMRTVRCSSRLPGGCLLAGEGCLPRGWEVSAHRGEEVSTCREGRGVCPNFVCGR